MISERIKELRKEYKMTKEELGARLGVTRSSVNLWEMGMSTPVLQNVIEMSKIFKVSVDYVLGLDDDVKISIGHLDREEKLAVQNIVKNFENLHEALELLHDNNLYITEDPLLQRKAYNQRVGERQLKNQKKKKDEAVKN